MGDPNQPQIPVASDIDPELLRGLHQRPWWATPAQATIATGTYAALAYLALRLDNWIAWPIIWWFQGFILSGFLGAAHDCAHGTFVRSAKGNRICGVLWASCVLFNFTIYKFYHLEHHRYTSVPGDTEPSGAFTSIWDYLRNLPTTAFFVSFWRMSLGAAARRRFPHFIRTERARRAAIQDSWAQLAWLICVVSMTVTLPEQMCVIYWAPMLVYFPMVFLTSLPEHYGCDQGPDVWSNTRSTTSSGMYRLYFWNGNFHAEHHLIPSLPSWNLPRLHQAVSKRFKYTERSYIAFHWNLALSLIRGEHRLERPALSALDRVRFDTYTARDQGNSGSNESNPSKGTS